MKAQTMRSLNKLFIGNFGKCLTMMRLLLEAYRSGTFLAVELVEKDRDVKI